MNKGKEKPHKDTAPLLHVSHHGIVCNTNSALSHGANYRSLVAVQMQSKRDPAPRAQGMSWEIRQSPWAVAGWQ